MLQQDLIYSEERGTWNLFVNGEWYYEGDYETCESMMFNNAADESEELNKYYEDPYPYEEDGYEIDLAREVAYAEVMD